MTDGFGLGCCFQWYMAGYVSSLLVQHIFVIHNNPPGGDILLGSSLTRITPPLVENTKVSLLAWCLLWYSFVAMSSTNMLCVWHHMQPFWLLTCLVLHFDCHVGLPLYRFYIISVPCNWWIWLGLMFWMIYGRIPQFTVVGIVLWQEPTIRLEGRTAGGITHQNHSSTDAIY
jgi:hypothetical protein